MLLSTAQMVTELARVKQLGWKLWAINQPLDVQVEIELLRVHVGYAKFAGDPQKQIFCDLGLVTVPRGTKLAPPVEMAGAAELAKLEPGLPLACVGVSYDQQEPLYRFQSNAADMWPAKVLGVTPLAAPPASLLIFKADLPTKPLGAMLTNLDGQICAVYAESSDTKDTGELRMHYAPLVNSELISRQHLSDKDLWVEPVVSASRDTTMNAPASWPSRMSTRTSSGRQCRVSPYRAAERWPQYLMEVTMYRCTRLLTATSLAVAILSAGFSSALLGQVVAVPAGPRIMLPPSYGATPLSTVINANAALTVARGSFLESAANARLTNAQGGEAGNREFGRIGAVVLPAKGDQPPAHAQAGLHRDSTRAEQDGREAD